MKGLPNHLRKDLDDNGLEDNFFVDPHGFEKGMDNLLELLKLPPAPLNIICEPSDSPFVKAELDRRIARSASGPDKTKDHLFFLFFSKIFYAIAIWSLSKHR